MMKKNGYQKFIFFTLIWRQFETKMFSTKENSSHQILFVLLFLISMSRLTASGSADADINKEFYDPDQYSTSRVMTHTECHIHRSLTSDDSFLTCRFAMDIRKAQKNFNVQAFRHGSESHELAVGCRWQKRLQCVGKAWIKLMQEDKTNVTFMMPLIESQSMTFSCHLNRDISLSTNCSLPRPISSKTDSSKTVIVAVTVSVSILFLASVLGILMFKIRQIRKPKPFQVPEESQQIFGSTNFGKTDYEASDTDEEETNSKTLVGPQSEKTGACIPTTSNEQEPLIDIHASPIEGQRGVYSSTENAGLCKHTPVATNDPGINDENAEAGETPKDGTSYASVSENESALLVQAMQDFVNKARQLAEKIRTDDCNANMTEQNLKTALELETECEYHEARIKLHLNSHKSFLRAEYEKMKSTLEDLQVDLESCKANLYARQKEIVRRSFLKRINEDVNTGPEYGQVLKMDITVQDLKFGSKLEKKDEDLDVLLSRHENDCIIIPAQHKSHVIAKTKLIGQKKVDILQATDDLSHSNITDLDNIHKKIHTAFSDIKDKISPGETMILMTQTNLDMYNKIVPDILVNKKATSSLEGIRMTKETHSDIMIVNKHRGILGGIVKSVHLTHPVKVGKILAESVSRLTEAANFIEEWLKTIPKADNVAVRMTLILPNISRKQLEEQLENVVESVVCLCKEEIDTPKGLKDWWEACWALGSGPSPIMDSSLYRNIMKKFAVPAIQVQKYLTEETNAQRENEAANYTVNHRGSIFHHWSLLSSLETLVDFDCLDDSQDDVKFLWGASGTGKTILLLLRALQWASHFGARTIFILQTTKDGTAAACLIEHQLQSEVDVECTFTHLDLSRLWYKTFGRATTRGSSVELTQEGKTMLSTEMGLLGTIQTGTAVHVVADEADGDVVAAVYQWLKTKGAVVVRLWAAGATEFHNSDILPSSLSKAACHVTEPLVCPKPAKKGAQGSEKGKQRTGECPAVEILRHTRNLDRHAPSVYPWRCEQCTKNIIDKLKSHTIDATGVEPQGLTANDVFVLGNELSCDKPEDDEFSPAPLIRILQSNGYNVSTLGTASARDHVMSVIRKTVRPAAVTVANEKYVWGLQRNVIVYCESGPAAHMDSKLRAICTTTRILIDIKSE